MTADSPGAAAAYDAYYYAHQLGERCHPDSPVWRAFCGGIADAIVSEVRPRTVLDVGCGIGLVVDELRRRNVDASGLDISPFAISQVPADSRPYCVVGSILDPLTRDYDLIVCIEVLEHLPPAVAHTAVANLARHTHTILFSSTPDDYREPTHANVRPVAYWAALFARHGFYRDHTFDPHVVAPHAMLLRRRVGSPVPIIHDYEDEQWRAWREIRELRSALRETTGERARMEDELDQLRTSLQVAQSDVADKEAALAEQALRIESEVEPSGTAPWDWSSPGFRLFRAMAGALDHVAPTQTGHGRAMRGVARRCADAIDWCYPRTRPRSMPPEVAPVVSDAVDRAVAVNRTEAAPEPQTVAVNRTEAAPEPQTSASDPVEALTEQIEVPGAADEPVVSVSSAASSATEGAASSATEGAAAAATEGAAAAATEGAAAAATEGAAAAVEAEHLANAPRDESESLRCTVETPPAGATVRVLATLSGWAIDLASEHDTGIDGVDVYLDDRFEGSATYGLPRVDVSAHFGSPRYLDTGWRFALDLAGVDEGVHQVQIRVRSSVSGAQAVYSHPLRIETPAPFRERQKAVLFISGCFGDATRYRCHHAVEQLGMLGVTADSSLYETTALGEILDEYQMFVLHRVPFGEDVAWFLEQAARRGKRVLFDTDDLVFDLNATRFIAALDDMNDAQREHFLDSVARCREALLRCDGVLVSTGPLGEFARELKERVAVVPNVVSRAMMREATSAMRWRQARSADQRDAGRITIAYLSGTATHNRDFLEAADGIYWALETYPHVRFMTVGPVTLDDRFLRFGERVERVPLQPWQRLPDVLAGIDISLAPLEPFNPFTDSKSCIKFLEAGLLGVPTIASPRWDFARAIQHGVNGLLANTPDEWRAALQVLIESDEMRAQLGSHARADVASKHATAASAGVLLRALTSYATPGDGLRPLSINWLSSDQDLRETTPRPSAELARGLAARGHHVRIVPVTDGSVELPAADVSIATDCKSASMVHAHESSLYKMHLVDEYEPDRYARNPRQANELAQAYGLPLRKLCLDGDLARRVAEVNGFPVDHLDGGRGAVVGQLERILRETAFVRLDAP